MNTPPDLTLLDALLHSGRLSADQKMAVERLFAEFASDPVRLADELLVAKVVNKYQHRKIARNVSHELIFGQYLIVERIGEGGMGKVYKAIETRLGREVALKTIRPNLLANKTVVQRYKREARAAASLTHPNIVELLEADDVGGRYFLAMEFVDGSDLSRLVKDLQKEQVPISPGEAAEYIRQAALGLQHAHDKGLVHRDVKPSNLLVSGERAIPGTSGKAFVKILDMGLVRSLTDDDDVGMDLTRDGTVVGTPDYMSPEQGKNSSTVDHRADIYSLGCTLFYLLRGSPPFDAGSAIDKLIRHQLDPVPDVRQYRPDVPPGLSGVIRKMMAKRPDERFQTCNEVSRELALYTGEADRFDFAAPGFEPVDFAPPASPAATAEMPPNSATSAVGPPSGKRTVRVIQPPPSGSPSGRQPKPRSIPKPAVGSSAAMPAPPSVSPPQNSLRSRPIPRKPVDATPTALGSTVLPRSPKSDPAGTSSGARRTTARKPLPKKKASGFPVVAAAIGGMVVVALIVVLAVLIASGNKEPSKPSSTEQAQQPPPPPPPVAQFRPTAQLLPNDTTAVLVCNPKELWGHLQNRLDSKGTARKEAGELNRFFLFDPKNFDRVTVALHTNSRGDVAGVAAGEGEVLKGDTFRRQLEQKTGPPLNVKTNAAGVTTVVPALPKDTPNPFNIRPRMALWPDPPAYFLGVHYGDLGDLETNPTQTGPTKADPLVLTAVAGVAPPSGPTPLAFYAAGGGTKLPFKPAALDALSDKGVDLLTVAVRAEGNGVRVTLTVAGKDRRQLVWALAQELAPMVTRYIGGDLGKVVAEPLLKASDTATETEADGRRQLQIEFDLDWDTVREAGEKALKKGLGK